MDNQHLVRHYREKTKFIVGMIAGVLTVFAGYELGVQFGWWGVLELVVAP